MTTLPKQITADTLNPAGVTLTTSTGGTSFGVAATLTNEGTLIDNTDLVGGIGTIVNTDGATLTADMAIAVGTIDNEEGGTITLSNSVGDLTVSASNPLTNFTNAGVLLASFTNSVKNVTETIDATFANTGTLQTTAGVGDTGVLVLEGTESSTGSIIVGAGTTLYLSGGSLTGTIGSLTLNGTLILGSNSVTIDDFSLAGTALLSSSGIVTLGGSGGTLGGILTDGGTVVLAVGESDTVTSTLKLGGGKTLKNEGLLTVNAAINGTGIDTVLNASGGTLAFTGGTVSINDANVVNDGTIEVSGSTVSITTGSLSGGGAIVVTAGTLDLSQASLTGTLGSITDNGAVLLGSNSVGFNGFSIAGTVSDSGTLTLGGSGTLSGALTGGGTVHNSSGSTLTLANNGSLEATITASAFVNDGVVLATFPASGPSGTGAEIINADLTNTGTIATTTGTGTTTLELQGGGSSGGSITVATGTTLDFNSGAYSIAGTYGSSGTTEIDAGATVTFASGTAVNVSTGTWRLGTTGGFGGTPNPGGTLDLSQATVTGPFNQLAMNGTLILGSNPVTVSGFAIAGEISDPGTLTLSSTGSESHILNGILTGGGTVVLASGQSATVTSTLSLSGGETLENEGLLTVSTGGIGSDGNPPDTLDNASGGTLAFTGGTVAVNVATVENDGLIKVSGGSAFFMGALNGAGAIDVAAGTLDLSPATLAATLGSITDDGTLDLGNNAVSVSSLSLAGTLFDSATVTMYGGTGAVLGGTLTGGHGTIILEPGPSDSISGALVLDDGETLKNESTLLISGTGITSDASATAIDNMNLGTLELSGSNVAIDVATLTNAGAIDVTGGITTVTGTVSSSGTIDVAATGTLDLSNATVTGALGDVTDNGVLDLGGNTVTINGFSITGQLADTATVTLQGGTDGGGLPYSTNAELAGNLSGGGTVVLGSFSQSYGITANLGLGLGTDQETLKNEGSLVVAAQVVSGNYGTLDNTSGATLTLTGVPVGRSDLVAIHLAQVENAGLMVVSAGSDAIITGGFTDTGTINVSSGATLDLSEGATVTSPLSNVNVAGTLLLGDSAVAINGLSLSGGQVDVASGGNLSLQQAVTGTGTLTIDSGSTLFLAAAVGSGAAVKFNGANGVLALASPASFGGSISGFAAGDTIDLGGTAATAASYADGNLVISDGGNTVATLALTGDYSASQFDVESDGTGGSDIVLASNGNAPMTTTYSGQISFGSGSLSFDGVLFNEISLGANVAITYQTPITSASANGTWSYTASAVAYASDSPGTASTGVGSGGTATELPFNPDFGNTLFLDTSLSTYAGSGGSYWIADEQVALDITGVTQSAISGTAIDYIHDNVGNVLTLTESFTLPSTGPSAAVPFDFNGDGMSDIVWWNASAAGLAVWEMAGATVLSGTVVAEDIASGWSVAGVGDFNDDGDADVLLQDASTNQLAIWEMSGASVVSGAVIGTVPLGWWVAGVGDFNGDGDADILFRNTVTGEVAIWEMDGFSILGSTAVGTAPAGWSVAGVGDFNGDGDADILWQNAASGQLSLWEMNGASVVSTATIGAAPTSWTVAGVGDFNGDGDADILFRDISTGQVAIWEMSGTNVLSYDTLAATMSSAWRVAEVGDFNGDGDADILWQNTTTGALTLWTMDGSTIASSQSAGNAGTGWQAGLSASPQAGGVPYDFFGDGTADILWQDSASGAVAVWQMDGSNVVGTSTLGSANGWQAVGVGDFSAYSGESILWQNSATDEMALWSVQGANVTSASVFASVPSGWQVAGVGDFFDAGTDDILWRNPTSGEAAIWEMNGTSVVSGTVIASGVDSAWKVGGVADFNGDGDADILWQNTATGAVAIWEMNGTSIAAATTIATPSADWQVAGVGDFAGNGTEDILLQNTTTDQLAVWQTNGTSVTGAAVIADDVPFAGGWQIAAVGDYTGSGADSILWQNPTTGQAALWQTNGATITATAIVATGIQPGWSVAHNPVLAA